MVVEMDEVSFVRIILIACGKKEIVVQKAATSPMLIAIFIFLGYETVN